VVLSVDVDGDVESSRLFPVALSVPLRRRQLPVRRHSIVCLTRDLQIQSATKQTALRTTRDSHRHRVRHVGPTRRPDGPD